MTEERTKPEFDAPTGRDLIVGDGDEAKPGDNVTVHYAGVEYESGEEFDSSWGRGESIQFPLRGLIQGWQDGIPGMKVGGRRELVIPPHLAYGPAGGHFLGGKTLIFIIDLLNLGGGCRGIRPRGVRREFFHSWEYIPGRRVDYAQTGSPDEGRLT